jgi:hypothetical protein
MDLNLVMLWMVAIQLWFEAGAGATSKQYFLFFTVGPTQKVGSYPSQFIVTITHPKKQKPILIVSIQGWLLQLCFICILTVFI